MIIPRKKSKRSFARKGFTLIEMIIVIGIFVVIMVVATTSLSSFVKRTQVESNADHIVHLLKKAQSNASMRVNDSKWGVHFDEPSGILTLFKGDTYDERTESFDEIYTLPSSVSLENISLNGLGDEVVFKKVTGETINYGSLEVSDDTQTKAIDINQYGVVIGEATIYTSFESSDDLQADVTDIDTGGGEDESSGGGGEPVVDITPPDAVDDLTSTGQTSNSITIQWTAPGEDEYSGTATFYDIRYLTIPITEDNWASAMKATGEPPPSEADTIQSMTINGLTSNTKYYFAIKTSDEVPNTSSISNILEASTPATEGDNLAADTSEISLSTTGYYKDRLLKGITITNNSDSSITIDSIALSWAGSSATKYIGMKVSGSWKLWNSAGVDNGTATDVNLTMSPYTIYPIDNLVFKSSIIGATLTIEFNMSDGSATSTVISF